MPIPTALARWNIASAGMRTGRRSGGNYLLRTKAVSVSWTDGAAGRPCPKPPRPSFGQCRPVLVSLATRLRDK
jgi:hypothetical protein